MKLQPFTKKNRNAYKTQYPLCSQYVSYPVFKILHSSRHESRVFNPFPRYVSTSYSKKENVAGQRRFESISPRHNRIDEKSQQPLPTPSLATIVFLLAEIIATVFQIYICRVPSLFSPRIVNHATLLRVACRPITFSLMTPFGVGLECRLRVIFFSSVRSIERHREQVCASTRGAGIFFSLNWLRDRLEV